MMGKTTDSTCRLCHQYPETVEHILADCPRLAQRQYLWLHNDALKQVLSVILLKHGLKEKHLQPYQPSNYYYNKNIEIMCDCTITTSSRLPKEGNRPDICIISIAEKKIDLLEMACPSWRNRAATEEIKTNKYKSVRKELKDRHPDYKIQQTNKVVDVLGGFDKKLKGKLAVLIGKAEAKRVLLAMQKTVWLHAIRIMNIVL